MEEIISKWGTGGGFGFTIKNSKEEWIASQMFIVIDYFEKLMIDKKFDEVIEIGTNKGGLTIILNEIKRKHNLSYNIHTFDIHLYDTTKMTDMSKEYSDRLREYFDKNNIKGIYDDCFSEASIKYIKDILASNKKVCLLCDGGDKPKEFNHFADFLKSQDVIMAHDYGPYSGWGWIEIRYENIKDIITKNNLKEYTKTDFKQVAWACYERI
jgi:hypothetical protein